MRYEKGTRQPRIEQIVMIATELGVSPLALIGDEVSADNVALVLGGQFEMTNNYKKRGYSFTDTEFVLINAFSQLNDEGQEKVVSYAQDLIPRYRAEPAPQAPSPPPEGTVPPRPKTRQKRRRRANRGQLVRTNATKF